MSNTKEFFLSVIQRIFSNWTALRVNIYFLKSAIKYMYVNTNIYIYKYFYILYLLNIFLLDGSGTWYGCKGNGYRFLLLHDRGYVHKRFVNSFILYYILILIIL